MKTRFILSLLLALVCALGGTVSATADSGDYADVVNGWFEQEATNVVVTLGEKAFPEDSRADREEYSIGSPHPVSVIGKDRNEIDTSDRWVATLRHGAELVGVVSAKIGADGSASEPLVLNDARLATEVGALDAEGTIIFDELLDVWFAQREGSIEPADAAAAEYILGSVPVDQFLEQRAVNVATTKPKTTNVDVVPTVMADDGPSTLVVVLAIVTMLAVLTTSIFWLRWDNRRLPRVKQTRVTVGKRALPAGAERSRNDAFDAPHVIETPTTERNIADGPVVATADGPVVATADRPAVATEDPTSEQSHDSQFFTQSESGSEDNS